MHLYSGNEHTPRWLLFTATFWLIRKVPSTSSERLALNYIPNIHNFFYMSKIILNMNKKHI